MRATNPLLVPLAALLLAAGSAALMAQQAPPPLVTAQDIAQGLTPDGSRWLTFGGDYSNQRHSPLTQITPANVHQLVPQWTFQTATLGNFQSDLLLRDNILYVTGPQNVNWRSTPALGARSGATAASCRPTSPLLWPRPTRGFGMLGDKPS